MHNSGMQDIGFSKSVTKVQMLPNIGIWNDETALIRDYVKCYFTKKKTFLRIKSQTAARKRVLILTPYDQLLVYETNCTGYCFSVKNAQRLTASSEWINPEKSFEKSCTITLKYPIGSVSLVLIHNQISIWRRSLSSIFECDAFDQSLVDDISLYTAKDSDDNDFDVTFRDEEKPDMFEYTDSVVSLKSAHACTNLSPVCSTAHDITHDAMFSTEKTNSNRSLTYLPSTLRTARSDSESNNSRLSFNSFCPPDTSTRKKFAQAANASVRDKARCVSSLCKKFEGRIKESFSKNIGQKVWPPPNKEISSPKPTSPPLMVLFPPPLPVKKLEDPHNSSENDDFVVSKIEYTPTKLRSEEVVL
ncbi:unnamed protein product [Caenorhabditis bovis]|uniref:DUF7778 domain-containing protein n=1 Tax=Caenorhabditis bovis TaxID=2654633 RepID=A0A8S1EJ20_9PELO|nr:unnamed protein product [Caenorhabditis bovis]